MGADRNMVLDSLPAASSLATKQFYAVTYDTAGKLILATAAKNIAGILQDKPGANEVGVFCKDGVTKAAISASQALSIGALLEVDTGSTLKAVASGTVVARARETLSSVAGVRVISVELLHSAALFA